MELVLKEIQDKISQKLALWPQVTLMTDDLKRYFDYYGFPLADHIDIKTQAISVQDYQIAVYRFRPSLNLNLNLNLNPSQSSQQPLRHVLIMHGYLDHVGVHSDLVKELLTKNCQVTLYDMPGHGLSTGSNAEIDDFSRYIKVLNQVLFCLQQEQQLPDTIIAHSTGAATLILGLLSQQLPDVLAMKIALIAPLVRIASWYRVKLAYYLARHWLKKVKLGKVNNSADKDFVDFLMNDPLRHGMMSVQWLEAAFHYEACLKHYACCDKELIIIQGRKDTTVAWRYNLRFLRDKFPYSRIYCLENAKHHVLYESTELRECARKILYERLDLL